MTGYKFNQEGKKYSYKVSPECLDAMIEEKINPSEIARQCGMTRQAVHLRFKKLGIDYATNESRTGPILKAIKDYIRRSWTVSIS